MMCLEWWAYEILVLLSGKQPQPIYLIHNDIVPDIYHCTTFLTIKPNRERLNGWCE